MRCFFLHIGFGLPYSGGNGPPGGFNNASASSPPTSPPNPMDIGKAGGDATITGRAANANINNNADVGLGLGMTMKPAKDIIISEPDQTHASVSHLLSRGYSLPCSTAAQAFTQLVQPTARFQLALDALLPLLDSQSRGVEVSVYLSKVVGIDCLTFDIACTTDIGFFYPLFVICALSDYDQPVSDCFACGLCEGER